jgi:homoserine O-acetyltransferase
MKRTCSAWAIGIGEVGRQAIFSDSKWHNGEYPLNDPPVIGMSVARQLAMLTYRAPSSFTEKFGRSIRYGARSHEESVARSTPPSCGCPPFFEVESYLNYQGAKFMKRFDPLCYVRITQTLDTHDIGVDKSRNSEADYRSVLAAMPQPALIVGVDSDILYPVSALPHCTFACMILFDTILWCSSCADEPARRNGCAYSARQVCSDSQPSWARLFSDRNTTATRTYT